MSKNAAIDKSLITGLILAGGRGSRMGSIDKGLQPFRGAPMVKHVIERLAPQVGKLVINANRNLETYAAFGVPVWPDEIEGFAGPLAGMQTGLHHCDTPYMMTSPCDTPLLPSDLVARLADALISENADLAVAATGEGESYQPQPVFCLMKASLRPHLDAFLQSGKRKIDAWYATLKTVEVRFGDEAAFSNINTLDELEQLQKSR